MILSNVEIHAALDSGRLIIDPEPSPRIPQVGLHCPYDTHSVDLTLGPELSVPECGVPITYDLTRGGSIAEAIRKNSKPFTLTAEQPFKLERNQFVLGQTREWIGLPLSTNRRKPCLAARIEGKSSRARLGLLVHFTAPTVHPDFSGHLTLEMINLGPAPILLIPGMAIAQLIIEEVKGCPIKNPSQFQGQTSPEGLGSGDQRPRETRRRKSPR